jgi:threonine/homoserine/homoserine lactone efflux protein
MLSSLASGLLLGLSCGLAPGPLLALVLAHSLRHGAREGCKIALSPLLTDVPIVLASWLLAARLAELRSLFGVLAICGGGFVLFLAWDTVRVGSPDPNLSGEVPNSWFKGVVTNLLNPHPWLFWITVGAPVLAQALARSRAAALAFLAGFYLLLIGSKIGVAVLAARSRAWLTSRPYRITMQALGILLAVFALLLIRDGLRKMLAYQS